ncbi:hypothetical protein Mapa_014715 [Marchantia paleacea]|nr:hypothetical protein Mapa_014715 [Marchantia paleacea]
MVETLARQVLQLTLCSQPTIIAGGGAASWSGASMPGMERKGVRQRLIDLGVSLYKFHASSGPPSELTVHKWARIRATAAEYYMNLRGGRRRGWVKKEGVFLLIQTLEIPSKLPDSINMCRNGMEWSRVSEVEKRVRRRFVRPTSNFKVHG